MFVTVSFLARLVGLESPTPGSGKSVAGDVIVVHCPAAHARSGSVNAG